MGLDAGAEVYAGDDVSHANGVRINRVVAALRIDNDHSIGIPHVAQAIEIPRLRVGSPWVQRFYLVSEGEVETDGKVSWRADVRNGIYQANCHFKFFQHKSALEQEIKTKEVDGYTLVSDTNYSSALNNDWLIKMGLRGPLHQ